MLCHYSPQAVSEGCKQWVEEHEFWPTVAALRKVCGEHEALVQARRPAIAGPGGETFAARVTRLGIPVTEFDGRDYDRWSPLMGTHNSMSDADLRAAIHDALRPEARYRTIVHNPTGMARQVLTLKCSGQAYDRIAGSIGEAMLERAGYGHLLSGLEAAE